MFTYQRSIFLMLVLLLTAVSASPAKAETFLPRSYWEFSTAATIRQDSQQLCTINTGNYRATMIADGNGAGKVGGYATNITGLALGCDIPLSPDATMSSETMEFIFKAGAEMNRSGRSSRMLGNGYFNFSINRDSLAFITKLKGGGFHNLAVNLNGIGRLSPGYYQDGQWHHIALTYNAVTGVKRIWVDGQNPPEMRTTVTPNGAEKLIEDAVSTLTKTMTLGTASYYDQAKASIDQVAIYETEIPSSLIYEHYLQAMAGQSYNFTDGGSTVPPPSSTTAGIDLNEFPPGEVFPTQIIPNPYQSNGNIMVTGINVEPLAQLQSFPLPRYKPGNTLYRIIGAYNPNYAAGSQLRSTQEAAPIAKEIAREASLHWNHMISVGWNGKSSAFNTGYIALANEYPNIPVNMSTFWGAAGSKVKSSNLPSSMYLQGTHTLSPAADPLSFINTDGQSTRAWVEPTLNLLHNRAPNKKIDHIDENGEVLPIWTQGQVQNDPAVIADKENSGISDWATYIGNRWARIVAHYRDQFLGGATEAQPGLPGLENTVFAHYYIDGYNKVDYSEARNVGTPMNGSHYGTSDMYVSSPWFWDKFVGSIHGLAYQDIAARKQQNAGDKLFSPYVNACFMKKEEDCVRPGQYLGMLKILGVWGAEFYYAGYFTERAPFPDPKGWAWQIIIPSYAQSITSRYEEFLRNGENVLGDTLAITASPEQGKGLRLWGGKSNIMVGARKLNDAEKYIISGMIGSYSNMAGASPLEDTATIKLSGLSLSFKVRRQGSVYYFDNTNPTVPIFYQLDDWQEYGHPSRWSSDFKFQAEVQDGAILAPIATERSNSDRVGQYDFSDFTSFVKFNSINQNVSYRFTPRVAAFIPEQNPSTSYFTYIRARERTGGNGAFTVALQKDGATISSKTIKVGSGDWKWYRAEFQGAAASLVNLANQEHSLTLSPESPNMDLDQVILTPNGGFSPPYLVYPDLVSVQPQVTNPGTTAVGTNGTRGIASTPSTVKIGTGKTSTVKPSTFETNTFSSSSIDTDQIKADQIKADQFKAGQIEVDQTEADQVEEDQFRVDHFRTDQFRAGQIRSDEAKADEVKADEAKAAKAKADKAKADKAKADKAKAAKAKADKAKADKAKAAKAKTSSFKTSAVKDN